MRLDKWLWHARFFKSRTLAARYVEKSRCRIDGRVVDKPHATRGARHGADLCARDRACGWCASWRLGERRGPATGGARVV